MRSSSDNVAGADPEAAVSGTGIPIRRPKHFLSRDMPRYWHGGGAFATHFLNSFSSTLPFGEAFFVRSVLHFQDQVDNPGLRERIRGFAGQEGQHSRIHDDHVDILLAQGYAALGIRNRVSDRVARWLNRRCPVLCLSMTAAFEHFTAMLARQVLSEPDLHTGDMHPDMALMWRWHALEEAEHKAVAFDLLAQVAPGHSRRVFAMVFNTLFLSLEILDRLIYMLWKDGLLLKIDTWSSGWRFLFGQGGFLRGLGADYASWYRPGFHPDLIDDRRVIVKNASWIDAQWPGRSAR